MGTIGTTTMEGTLVSAFDAAKGEKDGTVTEDGTIEITLQSARVNCHTHCTTIANVPRTNALGR